MEAIVTIKNVYGKELIYPVNEVASTFAALTGNKTLSRYDIDKIKSLGVDVSVAPQSL